MHAHCFMLVIICVTMTGIGARSSYFPMIAIFFYTCSVALNLALSRFAKSKSFAENYYLAVHLVCQLMPFWFYTYWAFAFLNSFIPMQGRDGPENKPEIWMSLFAAIFSVHFAGFIVSLSRCLLALFYLNIFWLLSASNFAQIRKIQNVLLHFWHFNVGFCCTRCHPNRLSL